MLLQLTLLLAGLAMIIKGGDWFVSSSVRIAEFLRMPRVVIGFTLVSLATTTPELVVSIMSGLAGESGLAVGNAVGSSICNIGLILGVMAAMRQINVHPQILRIPLITLFLMAVLLFFMTMDLQLSRMHGIALVLLGAGYFIFDFRRHWRAAQPAEEIEAAIIEEQFVAGHSWLKTPGGTTVQFLAGALLVVLGSKFLVDSAVFIAAAAGIPTIIIGLTVVAIGTSLPELVTAIAASRRNVSDLAVGNVLGANIANLSLIVGTAAGIHDVAMTRMTQLFNFPALLGFMLLLLYMILSEKRISRAEGRVLLGLYAVYLGGLILLTILGKT